jgi:endoglucanase
MKRIAGMLAGAAVLAVAGPLSGVEFGHVGLAAPDVLCVELIDGTCVFTPNERGRVEGATVRRQALAQAGNYLVRGKDPAWRDGQAPLAVGHKSKGSQFVKDGDWSFTPRLTHTLYLRLPAPLAEGGSYTLTVRDAVTGAGDREHAFAMKAASLRSESIHVTQVGFLPGTAKRGFLSAWAGTLGGLDLAPAAAAGFAIVDQAGKAVLKGPVALRRPAAETGDDAYKNNYQRCDVYEFDFSELRQPGLYRAVIPGLGCSFPFRIGPDAFREAYRTTTRGLYYQRCGCALDARHAGKDWARARCHHPADGKKVEETTLPLTEAQMGWGRTDQFAELPKRTTGKQLQYWGGWHDAGDWDRRAQHLEVAGLLIDVALMFPGAFGDKDLTIPESGNGVSDLVDEARWCIDFFRRGQQPDGGVRGGIESEGHPVPGTQSWNDPLHLYAYAPDPRCSYLLAWSAAKAARALRLAKKTKEAGEYLASAEKAWTWAEANQGAALPDQRNQAAAELYALTGKPAYHEAFKATSIWATSPAAQAREHNRHDQQAGAYSYVKYVPEAKADATLRAAIVAALARQGEEWIAAADRRAFRFAASPWRPMNWGLGSVPDVDELILAYGVKPDPRLVDAVASSCAWTLGGNPLNLVWVTGLGERRITEVLHIDSWFQANRSGTDDAVPGMVPGGPTAFREASRGIHGFSQRSFDPPMKDWPIAEQFAGNRYDPGMCEHTPVMIGQAAAAYAFMHAQGMAASAKGGK